MYLRLIVSVLFAKQKIVNEALRKALERQYNKELETLDASIEKLKQEAKDYLAENESLKKHCLIS